MGPGTADSPWPLSLCGRHLGTLPLDTGSREDRAQGALETPGPITGKKPVSLQRSMCDIHFGFGKRHWGHQLP